uniref:Uncharacterized protein n=1 Tax=Avena sativa TaxID=4498 RepID=A0ACD5VDL6_AVESA
MGGIVMRHHQISANPLRKAAFRGLFALQRGSLRRSSSLAIRAEANGSLPPRTVVKKHSKEELIEFFGGIQAAIARDSPRASRRTRKPSPADAFEDAGDQSYGN